MFKKFSKTKNLRVFPKGFKQSTKTRMILSELIEFVNKIAKESPESLNKPVNIHYETGCYSEILSISVDPVDKTVVFSEYDN